MLYKGDKTYKVILIIGTVLIMLMNVYTLSKNYCMANLIVYILSSLYIIFLGYVLLKMSRVGFEKFEHNKIYNLRFIAAHNFSVVLSIEYLFEAISNRSIVVGIIFIIHLVILNTIMYAITPSFQSGIRKITKH